MLLNSRDMLRVLYIARKMLVLSHKMQSVMLAGCMPLNHCVCCVTISKVETTK